MQTMQFEELGVHHLPSRKPTYVTQNGHCSKIENVKRFEARKENEEADTLAAQAMHGKEISSTYEIE
ncbi:hypothetical protein RYX51_04330 [Priestia filamentosa]|nr:hypothetical protein RYX51_04330 [Priestia filamentosa]